MAAAAEMFLELALGVTRLNNVLSDAGDGQTLGLVDVEDGVADDEMRLGTDRDLHANVSGSVAGQANDSQSRNERLARAYRVHRDQNRRSFRGHHAGRPVPFTGDHPRPGKQRQVSRTVRVQMSQNHPVHRSGARPSATT